MSLKPRYLTKSRFKLGLECPTKLFYTGKNEYVNQKLDDSFLKALAQGGFQIGELAKHYHPGGINVPDLDYETALAKTNAALQSESVTIFEAAIRAGDLFIRVDVLRKTGKLLEIFEVKSKSYDPDKAMVGSRGGLLSGWRPYVEDVAFQKHVIQKAFPEATVEAHLTLVDKTVPCPSEGLYQKFKVVENDRGRKIVQVGDLTPEDLSTRILIDVPVDDVCQAIYQEAEGGYEAKVARLSEAYKQDKKLKPHVTSACDSCEFRATPDDLETGLKCGRTECWGESLGLTPEETRQPTVLDIWDNRNKDRMIEDGILWMSGVSPDVLKLKSDGKPGLSRTERQWIQVEKATKNDDTPYVDAAGLKRAFEKWTFPLHFIDFETSIAAIPFNKGRLPYEGIAFQFSHHVMTEGGQVSHVGEYINIEPGQFPNYDFLRALKQELEGDKGSIFRYSAHEQTYLKLIDRQLRAEADPPSDKDALLAFNQDARDRMIDLLPLVKRFFFDPRTGGSNSIKYVLPAILGRSQALQETYSKPLYGADGGIPSLNFKDQAWLDIQSGEVSNPYHMLPKIYEGLSDHDLEILSEEEELKDGGAAMMAYARLQYVDVPSAERQAIRRALLKYCELDTLAMVMLYEGLRDLSNL